MTENCVLYDRTCINCGECDRCDLNSSKICDDCGECIIDGGKFRSLNVKDFFAALENNKNEPKAKIYKKKK